MTNQEGPLDIRVDDRVHLRKAHPCGGYLWRVVRIGADIGIRCEKCGRRLMLPRGKLEKSVKAVLRDNVEAHH